jgi:hypothetical protein
VRGNLAGLVVGERLIVAFSRRVRSAVAVTVVRATAARTRRRTVPRSCFAAGDLLPV